MRILLVEDDRHVSGFVSIGLREARYSVDVAGDGPEALHLASTGSYDMIIMDVMLPGMNGFQVVRELRSKGYCVPIIYLTAKDRTEDIVEGLEAGGDDYLSKPFSFVELLARVRAMLRRHKMEDVGHILSEADMKMDLLSRQVWRDKEKLDLTNKEFDLLEYFMRNTGQVLTRTMIAEHVWDIRFDFDSNLIDVHLARLRKKMESSEKPRLIHTLKGIGYVFRVE
ncbi:MAG: response regulator transcription factor [Planctomycetota bacterium]